MTKQELQAHLAAQTYDKNYQDIVPLGFTGYSKSSGTWARLADIVDWKGKTVVDLGCFHGYFCFRIGQSGAKKVTGLDNAEVILETCRKIGHMEDGDNVDFQLWDDTLPIPKADVTLCLNALHHFKDPRGCLSRIQSPLAVFEVQTKQLAMINEVFETVDQRASHRRGRVILLAKKR